MTDTPKKLIVDVATGTQTYVDLTPEEITQREADAVAAEAAKAEAEAKAAANAETKANAEAKLAGLGLTAEEIAALSK
jgi:ATPase subunit of ABC transporter with duplicated ATPase domains